MKEGILCKLFRKNGVYQNNLKNRFLTLPAFAQNWSAHSRFALGQWRARSTHKF